MHPLPVVTIVGMQWFRQWLSRFLPAARPGSRGEKAAARFLKKQGYKILARNLKNAQGEIDLIAQGPDQRTIIIVEVKSRLPGSNAQGPRPEVRVNEHKQRQLNILAMQFIRRYRLHDRPVRFDVIGVDLSDDGEPVIRHHPGAFESKW